MAEKVTKYRIRWMINNGYEDTGMVLYDSYDEANAIGYILDDVFDGVVSWVIEAIEVYGTNTDKEK